MRLFFHVRIANTRVDEQNLPVEECSSRLEVIVHLSIFERLPYFAAQTASDNKPTFPRFSHTLCLSPLRLLCGSLQFLVGYFVALLLGLLLLLRN